MVRFSSCLLIALVFLHYLPTSILADNYVVVVIDDSGSMDESMSTKNGRIRRINAAKNALRTVLSNLSPDTKIGLLALNQEGVDGNWLYPLALVDREKLLGVVNEIGANGGTPLGHAMKAATDALLAARDKDPFGTFRLLVVTDGEATDAVKLEQYLPDIVRRGITIDVIGVDMQKDHSLATKVHQYRRADDAEALNRAVAAVFAESDSATDQSGESDFDWIAGLPDEFAAEALAAVSKIDNTPVGTTAAAENTTPEEAVPSNAFPNMPNGSPANNTTNSGLSFGSVCCCFGSMIFLGVILTALLQSGKRRRRN